MNLEESLPLTEAAFHILLSLSTEPKHGYAVIKDVAVLSDGRINLSTGTLYGGISRFLNRGWIERVEYPEEDEGGRARKFYILTPRGRRVLMAEIKRMQSLLAAAQLRTQGESA